MLKIKMSPLSDVLSPLSDEINMQEDLSHEMCPHKPESPLRRGDCTTWLCTFTCLLYLLMTASSSLANFLHLAWDVAFWSREVTNSPSRDESTSNCKKRKKERKKEKKKKYRGLSL